MTQNNDKRLERKAKLRWVSLAQMRINPLAQREIKAARIDYLAANFDPDEFDVPTVNWRDGWFYVIDGQHRCEAARQVLGDDQSVQCWVYEGLTEQDEAEKFLRLNDTLIVHAFPKFKTAVTAERPIESDIDRIVRTAGLCVSKDKVPGAISAVGTLVKVYKRSDAKTFARSLILIRDAFGDPGLEGPVIDGLSLLCQRYNGQLDDEEAVKRLGAVHGGVNGLLNRAEVLRRKTGNYKSHCVAAAAVDIINSKAGGKKLPSWWKAS